MNQLFKRATTKLSSMLGIGRVTVQTDGGVVQTLQYQTPLEVASAPRLAEFGFSSGLPKGTDVVLACIGGDRSSPVVIATNHQGFRRTGLKDGETVIYSQWGQEVLLTKDGVFVDAKGKDVEVNNATNVIINASEGILANTPLLRCTGDIMDNCETNSRTLKDLRDAHNGHYHLVKNAQRGNDDIRSEKTDEVVA